MYENYTKQALPSKTYRELLGSALCVFNANNSFIIEKILCINPDKYNWYQLIDLESGRLKGKIKETISKKAGDEIYDKFDEIVEMRNRIIHSFQITDKDGQQKLATKTKIEDGNKQFVITEDYLLNFIRANEELCLLLYKIKVN